METQPTTQRQRYPRYKRAKEAPDIELEHPGANYFEILKALYTFRYLTTDHLKAHVGSPGKGIYQPLNRLYHSGLVERRYIFDRPSGIGSSQTIHALTPAGAQTVLGDRYNGAVAALIRRRLARTATTLSHHLAIAELHLLLYLGLRQAQTAALARFIADKEDDAVVIRAKIVSGAYGQMRTVTKWPDAFFVLKAGPGLFPYFGEIDQDDETRPRKRARVEERFRAYAHVIHAEKEKLAAQLGLTGSGNGARAPSMQVLFVVPTVARRRQLVEIASALRNLNGPHRIGRPNFWFLAREDYRDDDLLAAGRRLVQEPVLRGLNDQPSYLIPPSRDEDL